VASVASVSGLSIIDLLQFPLTFIRKKKNTAAIWHCKKAKNIGSMDPTTTTMRKTTQHNTEN
jgi:hypothetical protein